MLMSWFIIWDGILDHQLAYLRVYICIILSLISYINNINCFVNFEAMIIFLNIYTPNLHTQLTVAMLVLTAMIGAISLKTMPVAGRESIVTCAGLCYSWAYLMLGLCSLIKPTDMEKLMPFHSTKLCNNLRLTLNNGLHFVLPIDDDDKIKYTFSQSSQEIV